MSALRFPLRFATRSLGVVSRANSAASVKAALFDLIARQSERLPLPVLLCDLLIAAMALSGGVAAIRCAAWLLVAGLILMARFKVLTALRERSDVSVRGKLRSAIALSAINGIVQGLSVSFAPALNDFERAVLSIQLVGMCVGAVAMNGGYRPVYLAYLTPVLAPLCAMWAIGTGHATQRWVEAWLAVLIVLLGALLVAVGQDILKLFLRSFVIGRKHERQRKRLKEALAAAEEANRVKTRFLASASHDLRQPIHTLALLGATLMMRPLDARSKEVCGYLNDSIEVVTRQLDALLDISNLDAGKVKVNKSLFVVRDHLSRITAEFSEMARRKSLELRLDCESDAVVDTDAMLLERIMRNLIDNAIKYTDAGSIRVFCQSDENETQIGVVDSGRGIPIAEQKRVFDEFYQLENPERDREKGLGLGLAIVSRLTELLEIRIELTSISHSGTSIRLSLPRAGHRRSAVQSDASTAPVGEVFHDLRGARILVVENEAQVRRGMALLLHELGCVVLLASGTSEADALTSSLQPDVVLADLRLVGEDSGIAAVRTLRRRYPGLPALLVSGDTAPERLIEAHAAGIDLLHKPVTGPSLRRAIGLTLRNAMGDAR